jgi:hypothetical protein
MSTLFFRISGALAVFLASQTVALAQSGSAHDELVRMLDEPRGYHVAAPALFERLGWDLPDAGAAVKALADAAPGGAFDPRALEKLPAVELGYSARWHVVRFRKYGLDWDITGLLLTPQEALPDLPVLVFIHGGSSNWYEFFIDPLNRPGLGQYLAQKIPVLLITIPGNYRHGGWTQELDKRIPPYLLDRDIGPDELKVRNAAFTFRMLADGVTRLVTETTTGPVVISGHSTGGELSYMLEGPGYLKDRTHGRVLIWEGGSHAGTKVMQEERGEPDRSDWPAVTALRTRPPALDYTGEYLGPLNPVWDPAKSRLELAERWMGDLEFQRRAHFKQPLQDLERRGGFARLRESVILEVRQALTDNKFGVNPEEVIADLFAPMEAPLTGYRAIIRAVAGNDTAGKHNDATLAGDGTFKMLNELRQHNPDAEIRMLIFDVPMTHYGHIERPKQLAGGLLAALTWLKEQ